MSAITTKITPPPKVAGRFDTDFIETADKFLNQLPTTCNELNYFATQINNVRDEVNNFKDTTYNYMNTTLNYKNTTYAYKQDAISAANSIKSYVIPAEATYNQEALETALNDLLTQNIALQTQINILKNNIDITTLQNTLNEKIDEVANSVSPFSIIADINPAVSSTTTGFITDYQEGDTYSVYVADTDIVSSAIVDTNKIFNLSIGKVATFAFVTTATAGNTAIVVTRTRNNYKSQTTIYITSH